MGIDDLRMAASLFSLSLSLRSGPSTVLLEWRVLLVVEEFTEGTLVIGKV